jgi:hypothetical protein
LFEGLVVIFTNNLACYPPKELAFCLVLTSNEEKAKAYKCLRKAVPFALYLSKNHLGQYLSDKKIEQKLMEAVYYQSGLKESCILLKIGIFTELEALYLFYLGNNIVAPATHKINGCILPPRE